jgi:penicillin G amidase
MHDSDDRFLTQRTRLVPRWVTTLLVACALVFAGPGCSDDEVDDADETLDVGSDTPDGSGSDADAAGDTVLPEGMHIEGLSAPVNVQVDDSGVVHIDCQTNLDCYAAQGYFHAHHRFFEMDLIRRQTRGQLSQVIGSLALDNDVLFRHLMSTRDGEPLEEAYVDAVDAPTLEMLETYAAGVNAWLADARAGRNGATLTREYDFPIVDSSNIRDWEPEDTIALYLLLAYQLSESASQDLFRGQMAAELDPAVAADLFTVKPGLVSNTMQASGVDPSTMLQDGLATTDRLEALAAARQRLAPAADVMKRARQRFESNPSFVFGPKTGQDGSNNWAVAADRTRDGKALLADDPHLSLNNPAIWHFVELDSKTNGEGDLHVVGASVPAVPGVVVGHNDHIAWGVTTARLDLADAYIEELTADGSAVIFEDQEVDIIQKEVEFVTSDNVTETYTFEWVPHHGPILEKDIDNRRAVSMRWVAQEAGNDIDFLRDLMVATDVDEAISALQPVRTINQNWVFVDRSGSIGWSAQGAVPKRPFASADTPNWLPLPGDGSAEWDGYMDQADLPRMVDPPEGFIATANNDMDGSYSDGDATNDGHNPWQSPPAYGHRHKRIVDMLGDGGDQHTVDTMHDIQADTLILHAQVLVPHILDAAEQRSGELSAEAQQVVDALDAWQFTCPTGLDGTDHEQAGKVADADEAAESIGCSAFHVMLPYLTEAIFADELSGSDYDVLANWFSLQAALLYVFDAPGELTAGDAYFDDSSTEGSVETREDIVAATLEGVAAKLDELFGSADPDDWRWGRIHTVTFTSLFSRANISAFDNGPYANDGGFFSVDVANPTGRAGDFDDTFNHPNGPSLRVVFEASDEGIEGWFQLPGGQDHHEESPFYGSLIDDWLTNTPRELLYDRDAVDQAAVESYEILPTP